MLSGRFVFVLSGNCHIPGSGPFSQWDSFTLPGLQEHNKWPLCSLALPVHAPEARKADTSSRFLQNPWN